MTYLRAEFGVTAGRGFSCHLALLALSVASCNFDTAPIQDPRDVPAGTGGFGGVTGSGGQSGGGGVAGVGAGGGGSGGHSGASGGGSSCVPNSFIECHDDAAIRCSDNGRDRISQSCGAPGCNASEKRCNVCVPFENFCDDGDTELATCGSNGLVLGGADCEHGCNRAVAPPVCNQCAPNSSICSDANTLRSCDMQGNAAADTACTYGCTDSGSGTAACNVCVPGSVLGCADDGNQLICNATGGGTENVGCPNGCGGDGQCNLCVPNAATCVAFTDTLRTCDAGGSQETDTTCMYGCRAQGMTSSCNPQCRPGPAVCRDDKLVTCSATGTIVSQPTCSFGCTAGACDAPILVPSNLDANTCELGTAQQNFTVAPNTNRAISTDSGCASVRTQSGSTALPDICVMLFRNVTLGTGSTVTVTGSRALALVATDTMLIQGTIDASANGSSGGPGSATAGARVGEDATALPDAGENTPGNAGGGGGGHGQPGGDGGGGPIECGSPQCTLAGGGGVDVGTTSVAIVPLRGGARGGRNSAQAGSVRQGQRGGGGGALQLVSCNTITIDSAALVDVGGGGGEGGRVGFPGTTPGGGAGGGSGGALLIEAQTLTISATARLVANGGGGGGGATLFAGGDGQDATRGRLAAAGGIPGAGGTSASGGDGGCVASSGASVQAADGGSAIDFSSAAGGGGGGVGQIRINNTSGSLGMSLPLASPIPSEGAVTLR